MNTPTSPPGNQAESSSARSSQTEEHLLEIRELKTHFHLREGVGRAVDGVTLHADAGRILGIVGESGSGKSVTALSVLRLVPPPGRIESGEILFDGRDLTALSEEEMQAVRGNRISMVFQEPMTALNPVYTIGDQVAEVLRLHRNMSRKEARSEAIRMLELVRIPSAASRSRDYPHQMSGGMRQRAMIAMALACDPDLLIADEPTTALDVTVQAQILALMEELQESTGAGVILITHDLGVIAETARDVAVMYAGMIMESGSVEQIFDAPSNPYTEGLMHSIPRLEEIREGRRLEPIQGAVPSPQNWPEGCRFSPRCPYVQPACREAIPSLEPLDTPDHLTRCIRARELYGNG